MIYAFIKENHKHISAQVQREAIEKKAQSLGVKIDNYIVDNYTLRYCELWCIKRGYGSGSFYKNIMPGSTLLLHSLYTLTNNYKTTLFIAIELIKKNIKICTAIGDTLGSKYLKTLEILFKLKDQFDKYKIGLTDEKRPYNNDRFNDNDREDILNMINSGYTRADICRKYKTCAVTLRKWLTRWGVPLMASGVKKPITQKRVLLQSNLNRVKRRISATAIASSEELNKMLEMINNEQGS